MNGATLAIMLNERGHNNAVNLMLIVHYHYNRCLSRIDAVHAGFGSQPLSCTHSNAPTGT